jgi:hypothetical protein
MRNLTLATSIGLAALLVGGPLVAVVAVAFLTPMTGALLAGETGSARLPRP